METIAAPASRPEGKRPVSPEAGASCFDPAQLEDPGLLASLVAHRCAVGPATNVEAALAAMQRAGAHFAAVLDHGRVVGQLGRYALDEVLGKRFGFALYAKAPATEFATPPAVTVAVNAPLAQVLAAISQRPVETFYDDVLLLDAAGNFAGFIHTRCLLQVQHALLMQQIARLAASTESLNRVNRELAETYKGLVDASRRAGMAEIATGVLHNVGNVLNSLNVSANVIGSRLRQSKAESLLRLGALLQEQSADLARFFAEDPKGRRVPEFVQSLARHFAEERDLLLGETHGLQQNIDHIKEIVAMQQAYATMVPVVEQLDPATLMEDALRMNAGALDRHEVRVVREFQPGCLVVAEKSKVLQILVNLIRNAKYACDDSGRSDKAMTLQVKAAGEMIQLVVADNGVGIPPESLTRIFGHGFTTRANGHGFGLHSAANAAREMKGALHVHSAGAGAGATFTLELPVAPPAAAEPRQFYHKEHKETLATPR